MRKLIYQINITADGCCDHTKMVPSEEEYGYHLHSMQSVDVLVFGRKTYELMVPYWPDVAKDPTESETDRAFAQAFVSKQLVVFSRTLKSADDETTRIVRTDLRDEILRLKQQPGRDISVGGVDIPSQLIALGLVDEYRFVIHPVIAGEGRRLLQGVNLQEKMRLKLVWSKTFESGSVAHHYVNQ